MYHPLIRLQLSYKNCFYGCFKKNRRQLSLCCWCAGAPVSCHVHDTQSLSCGVWLCILYNLSRKKKSRRYNLRDLILISGYDSKTHGHFIADHDNVFNPGVATSVSKQIAGFHIAEVQFEGEVVQETIYNTKIGLPARFIFVID